MRGMTVVNADLERAEASTAPGMAHWAGGGPDGATCGKCAFWGYSYRKHNGDPGRRASSCEKYFKMMSKHGDSLDKRQAACKYFEAASEAEMKNRR